MHEPRVLTLDEIIASGDRLMWLEYKTAATPEHYKLVPTSPYSDNTPDAYSISFQSGHVQIARGYGRQWRCWTEKPSVADAMNWEVTERDYEEVAIENEQYCEQYEKSYNPEDGSM